MGVAGADGIELDGVRCTYMAKVWTHLSVGRQPVGEQRVFGKGVGA